MKKSISNMNYKQKQTYIFHTKFCCVKNGSESNYNFVVLTNKKWSLKSSLFTQRIPQRWGLGMLQGCSNFNHSPLAFNNIRIEPLLISKLKLYLVHRLTDQVQMKRIYVAINALFFYLGCQQAFLLKIDK